MTKLKHNYTAYAMYSKLSSPGFQQSYCTPTVGCSNLYICTVSSSYCTHTINATAAAALYVTEQEVTRDNHKRTNPYTVHTFNIFKPPAV